MSSLSAQIAVPQYRLTVNQQLSRREVVLELRLRGERVGTTLKMIRRVLKEASLSWIRNIQVDGQMLVIHTKTRMGHYRQDRARFYRRIRSQLDEPVLHSMRVHAEFDPAREKITRQRLRQASTRHSQPQRRPAPRHNSAFA